MNASRSSVMQVALLITVQLQLFPPYRQRNFFVGSHQNFCCEMETAESRQALTRVGRCRFQRLIVTAAPELSNNRTTYFTARGRSLPK
jgi:hypothetical protein